MRLRVSIEVEVDEVDQLGARHRASASPEVTPGGSGVWAPSGSTGLAQDVVAGIDDAMKTRPGCLRAVLAPDGPFIPAHSGQGSGLGPLGDAVGHRRRSEFERHDRDQQMPLAALADIQRKFLFETSVSKQFAYGDSIHN